MYCTYSDLRVLNYLYYNIIVRQKISKIVIMLNVQYRMIHQVSSLTFFFNNDKILKRRT